MMDDWNRDGSIQRPYGDVARETRKDQADRRREREERREEALDMKLDRGLEETFPGSDPVAVIEPLHSLYDRLGR